MSFTSFSGTPVLLRGLSHGFRVASELAQVTTQSIVGCSIVPIMFHFPYSSSCDFVRGNTYQRHHCICTHLPSLLMIPRLKQSVPVQFSLSVMPKSATPWTAACQASLSITNSWSLLKPMSVDSVMPSNHLILCCPLLLPPSIFPSIRVFSNESVLCIRWQKYWSFSFSISPSNEYSGLISFRIDWLDLLAVQGTQESSLTPQFKSINSSTLSFIYISSLTSIHDYWKHHGFDQMDLYWQSNVSAF